VIKTLDNREILVPFVDEIVPKVDLTQKRIVLNPPKGLFDEAAIEAK
jgi:16S rRNA processing protein RimM